VLSGGAEKKLRLWDLTKAPKDGSEWTTAEQDGGVVEFVMEDGKAHEGSIKSACFDEKRDSVISMAEDKVVR
jgi:serine-threonine kinase receptor-associated protein